MFNLKENLTYKIKIANENINKYRVGTDPKAYWFGYKKALNDLLEELDHKTKQASHE